VDGTLRYFTGFDDPLELFYDQRANPHCHHTRYYKCARRWDGTFHTLFANQRVISVVGVVGVAKTAVGVFKLEEFMTMLARMPRATI
jgi:hypothetical protein